MGKRLQHVLVTIPASNYCEKARWGLNLAKIDFFEEKHAPLFTYASVVPKGGKSVPFLILPDESVLKNSDEILTYCGKTLPSLYPNESVKAKEVYYDDKFGPNARRYAYHTLFSMGGDIAKAAMIDPLESPIERNVVKLSYPVLKNLLIRALNITPAAVERSWAKVEAEFERVNDILGDAPLGSRYLAGDTFSAADISFCSHVSMLLGPKQSRFVAPYLNPANLPPQFQARYNQLKESKAGQFVLYCYDHHYPVQSPNSHL
ncbi:hypothetical protein THRCLA_06266 [Thraustotheca clavata]|uniref:GST N-terminal domain-containing protein n=1 Tax=Thraustotheca clavata TaxID=74557 RepID=A0A1V9ZQK6_9STRA|nr:hypothetical protein THRCLA_06266 [Thraustotheca clavata]